MPVDSPEPEASPTRSQKRSSSGGEESPEAKRVKHEASEVPSVEDEIPLGKDAGFQFTLVGDHIFGQSMTNKRRIPVGTFVWASEDGKLEEHPDSPDLKDNPLHWSPTSRTKVWLIEQQEKQDGEQEASPPKLVSVGELLKNNKLTHIVGKGPVTAKNISRKACNLVWETKDETTRSVLSAMSSKYLDVSFVFWLQEMTGTVFQSCDSCVVQMFHLLGLNVVGVYMHLQCQVVS